VSASGEEPPVERLQDAARTVVDFANYDTARRNFATLTRRLLVAGLVAAAGIGDYAYWVSRDEPPSLRVTSPTPVTMSLPEGSDEAEGLGANCDVGNMSGVAVGGEWERPIVVTVPTDGCEARRFEVPEGAIVIPVEESSKSASAGDESGFSAGSPVN
jgi:hypothetical protein